MTEVAHVDQLTSFSAMRAGIGARLSVALGLAAMLWAGVLWAGL